MASQGECWNGVIMRNGADCNNGTRTIARVQVQAQIMIVVVKDASRSSASQFHMMLTVNNFTIPVVPYGSESNNMSKLAEAPVIKSESSSLEVRKTTLKWMRKRRRSSLTLCSPRMDFSEMQLCLPPTHVPSGFGLFGLGPVR
jgi:hypothetical protein